MEGVVESPDRKMAQQRAVRPSPEVGSSVINPRMNYRASSRLHSRRVTTSGGRSNRISGMTLTKEERDAILQDLQKKDDESGKKTMSRNVVEKYLSKVRAELGFLSFRPP